MNFKIIVTINAVLSFIGGLSCVLMPTQLLASYGISLIPMGLVIYQFWGAALMGVGMLSWAARNIQDYAIQKAFSISLFITNAINCAIAVRGQFEGANSPGWSCVGIFFLLALCFGMFLLLPTKSNKG